MTSVSPAGATSTGADDPLHVLLQQAIDRFRDASDEHKVLHRTGQTGIIALTAATTIAAGAGLVTRDAWKPWLQFLVLCLTASTAALAAWLEGRKARELWQHEREVYYALLDIQRELNFVATLQPLSDADRRAYFARVDEALRSSAHKWRGLVAKKDQ